MPVPDKGRLNLPDGNGAWQQAFTNGLVLPRADISHLKTAISVDLVALNATEIFLLVSNVQVDPMSAQGILGTSDSFLGLSRNEQQLPFVIRNENDLSLPFHTSDLSQPCQKPMTRHRLFYHFANSIASQLVWVDEAKNPWRELVCPLATRSPCVFYAVLAIAAANLHVNFDSKSPDKMLSLSLSKEYRRKAVFLLTHHLNLARSHSGDEATEIQNQRFRESLAATLLLWHLEMHFPLDSIWKLHLRTAQALIYRYHQSGVFVQEHDACNDFLLSEFYCATIWPRLTLDIEMDDTITRWRSADKTNAFLGFVELMHQITLLTPWSTGAGVMDTEKEPMSIEELESRATCVRQAILSTQVEANPRLSRTMSADVVHVVDAWFYAILIYGHRVIGQSPGTSEVIQSDCDCLFEALSALSTPTSLAQNQPWPLFIAGTECGGNRDRQMWVEARFEVLIKLVCPLDRRRVLEFLKRWWAQSESPTNGVDCWINFKQGATFDKDCIIW